tara:strand:- start:8149 stop:8760 length:612 start_codon:yes stop_codon:yes gene_type:complete
LFKLVIFDLDGVLVDACEWHRVALNEALKEVCNYEISLESHYNEYNGTPTSVKLKKLTEKGILARSQHATVYDLKQEKTKLLIKRNAPIRQEKIDLINWLKSKNLKVACFTNSIRETAELMLKKTGVYDLLDMVVTNQDVKIPKPNPEGYIQVLNYFNISKKDSIIVEDSPKGLEAAYASGCHVIQVANPGEVDVELFKEFIS